ncbi:MAG: XkdX family protein [Clostridia bacterium]|nr:XkdX family protein [Clostridia bacterium]
MTFEKIKEYYDNGFWNKEMVRNAVKKGKITVEQYEEIVGEKF